MNRPTAVFCLAASLAGATCSAQTGAKQKAPEIPAAMAELDRKQLTSAAYAITKGDFGRGAQLLKPLSCGPSVSLYVDYASIPRENRLAYRQAVGQAINTWNSALQGSVAIVAVESPNAANLLINFDRDVAQVQFGQARLICSDLRIDFGPDNAQTPKPESKVGQPIPQHGIQPTAPQVALGTLSRQHPEGRYGEARIALQQPYVGTLHSPASITHEVAQVIGGFFGLGPSDKPADLMGLDMHGAPAAAAKPSAADAAVVKSARAACAKLAEFAKNRVAIYLPRPMLAFDTKESDAGAIMTGENPRYVFKVKNAGDAPLEIFAKPNCGCTLANYDKVIAPHGSGTIEAVFNSNGFSGRITKLIDVTSNDPENPTASLRILATVKPILAILPDPTPTIPLKDSEPTVKELTIEVNDPAPVQVTKLVCNAPYATAEAVPEGGANSKNFKLLLKIGAEAPIGRSVFTMTGYTTSTRQPQFVVVAICEKGIMAVPTSVFMGNIDAKTVLPLTQIATLQRKEGHFKIQKVEPNDPSLEATVVPVHDGSEYQIKVAYKGGWAPGQIFRKIAVHTDDPKQPVIELQVLAFMRSAPVANK